MRNAVLGGALALVGVACSSSGGGAPSASAQASGSAAPAASAAFPMKLGIEYSRDGKVLWCVDFDETYGSAERAQGARDIFSKVESAGNVKAKLLDNESCAPRVTTPPIATCTATNPHGTSIRTYFDASALLGVTAFNTCKGTWSDTFGLGGVEELRKLACAKDVAGFFKRVDGERVIDGLAKHAGGMRSIAARGWNESVAEWSKDIDRGDKGFVCAWELTGFEAPSTVLVKTVSGRIARIAMERREDTWMMVGYDASK